MPITVHRWGGGDVQKRWVCSAEIQFLPQHKYIRIYPIFIPEVPFNPFCTNVIKPQNYLLTKFFMSKKYLCIYENR